MARKKARETYGNGSITSEIRNGEAIPNSWRVCISLGTETYTDEKGNVRKRQRKIQRTVHGSLADARKVCRQLSDEYENINFDTAKLTFADVVNLWKTSMQNANTCAPSKLKDYITRLQYVAAEFDKTPIIEIKRQDVEAALASVKVKRNISQRTYHDLFLVTKRVFEYAANSDIIVKNPTNGIESPKVTTKPNRRSLTSEECTRLRRILDRDEEKAYDLFKDKEHRQAEAGNLFGRSRLNGIAILSGILAVRLMLATGMRRGEALGLIWKSVDFEQNQVSIHQAFNKDGVLKSPKTSAGIRTVCVDADTMAHLKLWKQFQASALHLISNEINGHTQALVQSDETPVFINCVGDMYEPGGLSRWWDSYRISIGFPDLKMHELRHTQATLLLGNGVDIKSVQARLGHSDASLTLNTYSHAIPANDRAAADLIGSIFESDKTRHTTVIRYNKSA